MSNLGVIASRFDINSKSLKEFDTSLRILKKEKNKLKPSELNNAIGKILKVVEPISEGIKDNLSTSVDISENNIINILQDRHEENWPKYRENIIKLRDKLRSKKFQLSEEDFQLLEDIADALDAECGYLFQRLSERI
ncbi:MAG: hypothetical protein HWN66_05580 [Candidatus Helarchaeota archaeon]|nr:hypothetical protein [Candidatus Helarchaeota archaeon]